MSKINIIEVGPRDGLQNEKKKLSLQQRFELIKKLKGCGLKNIEVGAFVSPKWIPQMRGSGKLITKLYKSKSVSNYSCLVPNLRGLNDALKTPIKNIAVFTASSESFSKKNINCSISESFTRFSSVIEQAHKKKMKVRGYLSTAFGCPYEGKVSVSKVSKLTQKLLDLGVHEVAISDTIGVATPKDVDNIVKILNKNKVPLNKIALHMHNTRGIALANVLRGIQLGVKTFDTSIGGLGGCPYAGKGASGNLATEDLVYMLHGMGYKTGIDIKKLIGVKNWLQTSCKLKTRSSQ